MPSAFIDERAAVEHQLVLAAHLVDVRERQAGFGDALACQVEPLMELVDLERRAVRHEQQLGAARREMRRRTSGTRCPRRSAARAAGRGRRPAPAAGPA